MALTRSSLQETCEICFYWHSRAGDRQGYTTMWLSHSKVIPRYDNYGGKIDELGDEGYCLSDIAVCDVSLDRKKFSTVIFSILPITRRKKSSKKR